MPYRTERSGLRPAQRGDRESVDRFAFTIGTDPPQLLVPYGSTFSWWSEDDDELYSIPIARTLHPWLWCDACSTVEEHSYQKHESLKAMLVHPDHKQMLLYMCGVCGTSRRWG